MVWKLWIIKLNFPSKTGQGKVYFLSIIFRIFFSIIFCIFLYRRRIDFTNLRHSKQLTHHLWSPLLCFKIPVGWEWAVRLTLFYIKDCLYARTLEYVRACWLYSVSVGRSGRSVGWSSEIFSRCWCCSDCCCCSYCCCCCCCRRQRTYMLMVMTICMATATIVLHCFYKFSIAPECLPKIMLYIKVLRTSFLSFLHFHRIKGKKRSLTPIHYVQWKRNIFSVL